MRIVMRLVAKTMTATARMISASNHSLENDIRLRDDHRVVDSNFDYFVDCNAVESIAHALVVAVAVANSEAHCFVDLRLAVL